MGNITQCTGRACAECGYIRSAQDDLHTPSGQCPECGAIYKAPTSRVAVTPTRAKQSARSATNSLRQPTVRTRSRPADKATSVGDDQLVRVGVMFGASMISVGPFMPVASFPLVGPVTYVMDGRGDGIIVCLLGLLALFGGYAGYARVALYAGLAAGALLLYSIHNFIQLTEYIPGSAATAETPIPLFQIMWGFPVIALGILVVTIAALHVSRE